MRQCLRVRLVVGDIVSWNADAITVSSNRTLSPNNNASYWRFAGHVGTNGAVHSAAGPELLAAIQALPPTMSHQSTTPTQEQYAEQATAEASEDHNSTPPPKLDAGHVTRKPREIRKREAEVRERRIGTKAVVRCDVGDAVVTPRYVTTGDR